MTEEEKAAYIQAQAEKEQAAHLAQYSTLKTEFDTDSQGLGFLIGLTEPDNTENIADNQKIADSLNDKTKGGGEVDRTEGISFDELRPHIDIDEFSALSEAQQNGLLNLYTGTTVDVVSQVVQDQFKNLFGEGSKTEIAIKALKKRPASRGKLLGYGSNIKYWDVARMRGL
jgi:hypothetical protein